MSDHPIIFSAPMVRALLDGRKTMTRRLAWRIRINDGGVIPDGGGGQMDYIEPHEEKTRTPWQRVKAGDRLWVREKWQLHSIASDLATVVYAASINASWTEAHNQFPVALADGLRAPRPFQEGWRSPLHLPRWASRLTLILTATKIERLQEISESDSIKEGIPRSGPENPLDICRREFSELWRKLHGPDAWDANPEVVALTFTVHKQNIDAMPKAEAA